MPEPRRKPRRPWDSGAGLRWARDGPTSPQSPFPALATRLGHIADLGANLRPVATASRRPFPVGRQSADARSRELGRCGRIVPA